MRKAWFLFSRLLPMIASARKGKIDTALPQTLLELVLARGLARTPMGMISMMLLRKALAGEDRVFGMDLASRREARMAWLAGLFQRFSGFSAQQRRSFRRKLPR